ncbi:MAG: peptidoglycan-binding protein [Acidimicrobiia bacterium]
MTLGTDLLRGVGGEPVRELQQRLSALGFTIPVDEHGVFGPETEQTVRAFQSDRGLRADGVCGRQTWAALVESGYALGDRLLYRRNPMLRGDDVATLQQRLDALGFDAGREDGIFGEDTGRAVAEFQRNAGLTVDGIFGPQALAALTRLDALADGSIAAVREREALRRARRDLTGQRIFVVAGLGLEQLADVVARDLVNERAEVVLDISGDDDSFVAAIANRFGADLVIALQPGDAPTCVCAHFASGRFRSEAGFRVASAIAEQLAKLGFGSVETKGRALPLLRETRMAAVVCEPLARGDADAMRRLVERSADVGRAIVIGIRRAVENPALDG